MKIIILLVVLVITLQSTNIAQIPERLPDGGGSSQLLQPVVSDEMTPQQKQQIIQMLQANELQLTLQGKIRESGNRVATTLFSWPVKQASFSTDNGFYGISNYVDENPSFPNLVQDYNCGTRSYDLSSGYNHAGTDIFLWPFAWQKMSQNAVLIVAAAPGIIIGKSDNNADTSCAMCTVCSWNAVYIRHADGSVAWYGHMKKNSQTTKALGESVAPGEVLGVVGSSGNSTAPHLHFEGYTNSTYTQLVDPWAGACNVHNGNTTWWANQQPYRVSTLNKIMTHGAPPVQGCMSQEAVNEKVNFVNGETVYLGTYYRDQLSGQQSVHTIYRPDNTIFAAWTQVFGSTFSASWWWYTLVLPTVASPGVWKYSVDYVNGQTVTTSFDVNSILPVKITNFQAFKNGNKVTINFNTNIEDNISYYNLLKSTDGQSFKTIQKIPAKGSNINAYTVEDKYPETGTDYYQLEIIENDGSRKYSAIQQVIFNVKKSYLFIAGNPFNDNLQLNIMQPLSNVSLDIVNVNGQVVYRKWYGSIQGAISIQPNITTGVYMVVLKNNDKILERQTVIKQ